MSIEIACKGRVAPGMVRLLAIREGAGLSVMVGEVGEVTPLLGGPV